MFLKVSLFEVNILNFSHLFFFPPWGCWFCWDFFFSFTTWFLVFFSFLCHIHLNWKKILSEEDIYSVLLPQYLQFDFLKIDLGFFFKDFLRKGPQWKALRVLQLPWTQWKLVSGYGLRFTPVQIKDVAQKGSPLPASLPPCPEQHHPTSPLYQDVETALAPTWLIHSLQI